ncbi:MAG: hypothetical protein HF975_04530 [ANME-2 cluster archaeon]|nr:hypothetical protein [ANME-2 cluster archaeon]
MCCTNNCRHRGTCKIQRLPMSIYTRIVCTKNIFPGTDAGIYTISIPVDKINPETYLNEAMGMVTSDRLAFTHTNI